MYFFNVIHHIKQADYINYRYFPAHKKVYISTSNASPVFHYTALTIYATNSLLVNSQDAFSYSKSLCRIHEYSLP